MDAKKVRHRADAAEDDAVAAVAFAEAALEEAEYAVLTATLARMDADAAVRQSRRTESSRPRPRHTTAGPGRDSRTWPSGYLRWIFLGLPVWVSALPRRW